MKKISLLALIFTAFSVNNVQAQSFTEIFDSMFVHVSRAKATTGILYDRVIPFSGLKQFSGSNPDTASMYQFLYGFHELYNAAFDPSKRLPFDGDSLERLVSTHAGYVDIGILHYRFNTIDSLVARQKLYFGIDSVLYENSAIAASLYNEKTVLLISPLKEHFYPGNMTFRFSSLFHFDNTGNPITQLRINFDDGSGWQTVGLHSTKTIYYPEGEHTLSFIATYSNGQSDTCYAGVSCSYIQYAGNECTPPPFQTSGEKYTMDKFDDITKPAFIGYPFTDYDGKIDSNKGNVWIYYATTEKVLRKPILIVDGFDPGNPRKHESHTGDRNAATNQCGKSIWAMLKLIDEPNTHLGHKLIDELGYDLVVLDLPEGGDYIERNAMVAIKVIEWINQQLRENGSEEEIVVVGPSMGGQITRYALAYMEKHENVHGKHNCRLWVSFDSPHQGANISLGTQAWALYFKGVGPIGKLWDDKLKCAAAGQMLMHHMDYNSRLRFNKYYNLNNHTIGYLEKFHYPSNLRKIAISNGSLHGTKTGNGGEKAFSYNPPFVPGAYLITSSVYLYPEAWQTVKVFDVWHLLLSFIPVNRNHWTVKNNTNMCSVDAAPGCLYNTFFQVKNGHVIFTENNNKINLSGVVLLNKNDHCFMPTTSVLDISGNMNYCTNISDRDLVAEGRTPFQSYCGPGSATNMEHISLNRHIANWLLNEIETYTQGPKTIELCEYQNYTVHLPGNVSSSTEVFWTCSDNLIIVSGQGTKTITVKALATGDTWVQATVGSLTHSNIRTDAPNLAQSKKQLKKHYVTVIYSGTYPSALTVIRQNTTWNAPRQLNQPLTVQSGATLTIRSTVYCAPLSKIIVNPGGKLIIDGGVLTNACDGESWQGVEIHGNPDDRAQNLAEQGVVELKNSAVIENARIGILVGSSVQDGNRGGGVVTASNSTFVNCAIGVEFKPFVRLLGNQEIANRSHFANCEFIWDAGMLDMHVSVLPYTHAKLAGVSQITFKACAFRNHRVSMRNPTQGIYAHNASVRVAATMTQNTIPAQVIQRGLFENLTYGIYYEKSTVVKISGISKNIVGEMLKTYNKLPFSFHRKLTVTYSDFIGNVQGIFNTNANNTTIQHCYFKPASLSVDPSGFEEDVIIESGVKGMTEEDVAKFAVTPIFTKRFGVGINMNASTGYVIQGNTFSQLSYETDHGVGIHVKNSGGAPNVIDNNKFELLYIGILTNGNNKTDYTTDGLQFLCNQFSKNCQYAIAVNTPNGIAYYQGSVAKPAGNTFSHNGRGAETDIYSPAALAIRYYYNPSVPEEEPKEVSYDIWRSSSNESRMCGLSTGLIRAELRLDVEFQKTRYANISYNYNNLIDGGSTSQLLTELELSWDKTAWEIKDQLLSKSPYLSPEVIMDVAENGTLPHAMLLEVCLANPDATLKGELLDFLRHKLFNPMPEYMCELIVASWERETFRTHLESSLSDAALDLEYASRQLINCYDEDTASMTGYNDSIIAILERLPNIEAMYDLADLYASTYQFDLALAKMDELSRLKLSEHEEKDLHSMRIWYDFIKNHAGNENEEEEILTHEDIELLKELAGENSKAGARAKSLLYYYSGCSYNSHVEPEFPDFSEAKSMRSTYNSQDMLNDSYGNVSVFPNPAGSYATFMYEFQSDVTTSVLQISDSKGVIVLSTELPGNKGHYLWDTRNLSSGTYVYEIISSEKILSRGKIIVKK